MTDFKDGDYARFKGDGRVMQLDFVNPDPDFDPKEEVFADAHYEPGYHSVEVLSPDDIEPVTRDEIDALYQLPTVDQIAAQVSSSLHSGGWDEVLSISESGPDGPGVIEVLGRTSAGLGVSFKVTVSEVESYDD